MNKQKGFTFIEILVTVAVVGLIILVSSSLNKDVIVFSRIFQSGLNAADEARKILRQIANEIRSDSHKTTLVDLKYRACQVGNFDSRCLKTASPEHKHT